MLPGLSWLKIYPQGEHPKNMLSKISLIHDYRKCFTKYCTDGIELFNYMFLKTPTMFNVFENQDSLFKIIDFSICQRNEYHSTRALIGSSDAGYPVLSTSGRSSVTARAHSSHFWAILVILK